MTSTDLILIAALLLAIACFAYIFFGAQRLYRAREERVNGAASAAPPEARPAAAEPPVAPPAPLTPAPLTPAPPTPASPAAPSASPFLSAPDGAIDDLMRIKGIGPKLSARLGELGVFHYRQIAGWTPEQLAQVDSQLGSFQGRPQRDQWQSQASLLAAGDVKAYERAHGKLEPSSRPPGKAGHEAGAPGIAGQDV